MCGILVQPFVGQRSTFMLRVGYIGSLKDATLDYINPPWALAVQIRILKANFSTSWYF